MYYVLYCVCCDMNVWEVELVEWMDGRSSRCNPIAIAIAIAIAGAAADSMGRTNRKLICYAPALQYVH